MKVMYGEILTEILNIQFYLCCNNTYRVSKSVSVSLFKWKEKRREYNLMAVQV
jgi:hypothetical protein